MLTFTILFTYALAGYRDENWCDNDGECPRGEYCVPRDAGTCDPSVWNPENNSYGRCSHECSKRAPRMGARVVVDQGAEVFCLRDSHCASYERCTTSNFCLRKTGGLHGERCERPKHYQCAEGHACSRAGFCVDQKAAGGRGEKCAKDSHCAGSLICEKSGKGLGTCQDYFRRLDGDAAEDEDAVVAEDAIQADGDQRRRSLKYTLCHTDSDCFDKNERCTSGNFCLNKNGGIHGNRCQRNDQCARGHNCSRDQICVDTNGGGQGEVCTRNYHCKPSLKCINPFSGKAVVDGKKHEGECRRETPRVGRWRRLEEEPAVEAEETVAPENRRRSYMEANYCDYHSECPQGEFCVEYPDPEEFTWGLGPDGELRSPHMCSGDYNTPGFDLSNGMMYPTSQPSGPVRIVIGDWRRLEDGSAVEAEETVAPENRRRSYRNSNYCDSHSDCPQGEYCVEYPNPEVMTMGYGPDGELRSPHMCSGDYNTPGFDLSSGIRYPTSQPSGPVRIVIGDWRRLDDGSEAGPAPTM